MRMQIPSLHTNRFDVLLVLPLQNLFDLPHPLTTPTNIINKYTPFYNEDFLSNLFHISYVDGQDADNGHTSNSHVPILFQHNLS